MLKTGKLDEISDSLTEIDVENAVASQPEDSTWNRNLELNLPVNESFFICKP